MCQGAAQVALNPMAGAAMATDMASENLGIDKKVLDPLGQLNPDSPSAKADIGASVLGSYGKRRDDAYNKSQENEQRSSDNAWAAYNANEASSKVQLGTKNTQKAGRNVL